MRKDLKAKISAVHWWQYLSIRWWKNKKVVQEMIEHQINNPKFKEKMRELMSKKMVTGEEVTKEDIDSLIKLLDGERLNEEISKVYYWVMNGGDMPFEKDKMIKLLDELIARNQKAIKDLDVSKK